MGRRLDLTGQRFGKLTVIGESGRQECGSRKRILWLCRCDCGAEILVRGCNLRSGNTSSCGCLQRERTSAANTTHGCHKGGKGRNHRLYTIWSSMKARCLNPHSVSYKHYGARGITVCASWMDFGEFMTWALANGYRDGLSIERLDNNRSYEPSNCTWIPLDRQASNKRDTIRLTFRGVTKPMADWARSMGMDYMTLYQRIRGGWNIEKAIARPKRRRRC